MLPYSTADFFILCAILLSVLWAAKKFLSQQLPYRYALLGISAFYYFFFFPEPYLLFFFLAYTYAILYIFEYRFSGLNKLWGCLALALPMVLVKANVMTDWISFAGLSYVTFRGIQIYIDHDKTSGIPRAADFVLFLAFPFTILIGPIDRFERFKSDLQKGYAQLNTERIAGGLQLVVSGVLYKFVLAELINRHWLSVVDPGSIAVPDMLNNMYAYTAFLFFDFAGYSAMAVGAGKMAGIDVPVNFNAPFLAANPQDFWRRWHISLGDWLRDYIFRPVYKWFSEHNFFKPLPLLRQNLALFLTFLVMGLWNGFSFNYILSGSIFGLYSVAHNSYVYYCRKYQKDIIFGKMHPVVVRWSSILLMAHAASFAIYIFGGRCPLISN